MAVDLESRFQQTCAAPANDRRGPRVMVLSDDRVFYCGLLGARGMSVHGSVTLYFAAHRPFRLHFGDGRTIETRAAAVEPFARHRIESPDACIGIVMLEPETVVANELPWHGDAAALERIAGRARDLHARLAAGAAAEIVQSLDVDTPLFGAPLPRPRFDPRIARVVERIRRDPGAGCGAECCAEEVGLSFSRFLHLFRAETGVPFRSFKVWKRARTMLRHVTRDANLTHLALEIGYPGASHFSNSIRQVFGMQPREMFAGSRRLQLVMARGG